MSRASLVAAALAVSAAPSPATAEDAADIIVTARLRPESAESVPQALTVVTGEILARSGINNPQGLTLLVPSLNFSSANPRNTSLTIRGLGSSVIAVAQSNDGLEPGVALYVDQVFQARPAAAAFDFTDIERIEVLRGPQGTLFGKNSTAGAVHVITRAPSFTPQAEAELSLGGQGWRQARGAVTGPLTETLALRVAGLVTRRDGTLVNSLTGRRQNNLATAALRAALLWQPDDHTSLRLTADWQDFDAECCTQVFHRVSPTRRPPARQFPALAAALGYAPPSQYPYDRLTDIDAPVAADTSQGGLSAVAEVDLGATSLTSVSAWRFWNWTAANDRDYTRLSIQTLQRIPSRQDQFSQELRLASIDPVSAETPGLAWVAGLYTFRQLLTGRPTTAYGAEATFWLLGPAPQFRQDLLDGYRSDGETRFTATSLAAFGEATFRPAALPRLALTAGLRGTRERKQGSFASTVSGGAPPRTQAEANAKLSILRPQAYAADLTESNVSGRLNLAFDLSSSLLAYGSWARGYKSGGINMSGLPLDAAGNPALATAVIRPERNSSLEAGLKGRSADGRFSAGLALFSTVVRDFQANVVDTGPGALRGYLANIPRVTVRGAEFEATIRPSDTLSLRVGVARTEGRYADYPAGPCPLELVTSGTTACNLSGRPLPNLPDWVVTTGLDAALPLGPGSFLLRADSATRSAVSGDGPASAALELPGYTLVNASLGYGWGPFEALLFARNLTDARYLLNATAQAGNSGLVLATPADPRLLGVTLRWRLDPR